MKLFQECEHLKRMNQNITPKQYLKELGDRKRKSRTLINKTLMEEVSRILKTKF